MVAADPNARRSAARLRVEDLRARLHRVLASRHPDESWLTTLAAELDRAVHAWLREWMEATEPPRASQATNGPGRPREDAADR